MKKHLLFELKLDFRRHSIRLMQENEVKYKMNYLSVEELTENLVILLDETLSAAAGDELVQFPNEE